MIGLIIVDSKTGIIGKIIAIEMRITIVDSKGFTYEADMGNLYALKFKGAIKSRLKFGKRN